MGNLGGDDNGHTTQAFPLCGGFTITQGNEYWSSDFTYKSIAQVENKANLLGFTKTVGVTVNDGIKVSILAGGVISIQPRCKYVFDTSFTVALG